MEKKKVEPKYYKYGGVKPVVRGRFVSKKDKKEVWVYVWASRDRMNKLTLTKRERKRGEAEAVFTFKYKEKGVWVGDIHFYKQKIKFDWIAHEVAHATTRWFNTMGKTLNSRNEEAFATMVGSLSSEILSWLKKQKKVKVVL
jgi:hypothetical protein